MEDLLRIKGGCFRFLRWKLSQLVLCADERKNPGESREQAVNLGRKFLWRPRMAGVLCVSEERTKKD